MRTVGGGGGGGGGGGRLQGGEVSVDVSSSPPPRMTHHHPLPPATLLPIHPLEEGDRITCHDRRDHRRVVDESFLSFRPGGGVMMMTEADDDDFPHESLLEAVEVYGGDDEAAISSTHGADPLVRKSRSGASPSPYLNVHTSILDESLDDEDDEGTDRMADDDADGNDEALWNEEEGGGCPSTPQQHRQRTAINLIPPNSSGSTRRASRKPLVVTETPPPPPSTPRGGRGGVRDGRTQSDLVCGGGRASTPSLVDLTDRLVGMCFGSVGTATPVPPPPPPVSTPGSAGSSRRHHLHYHPVPPSPMHKGHRSKTSCVLDAITVVQEDMFQFLGCSNDLDPSNPNHELGSQRPTQQQPYWSEQSLFCFNGRRDASALLTTTSSVDSSGGNRSRRPSRITFRERAERVRRYHAERNLPHKRTGLALLPEDSWATRPPARAAFLYSDPWRRPIPLIPCRKSRSLIEHPVADTTFSSSSARRGVQRRKQGARGSDHPMELGYDSDPEVVVWGDESGRATTSPSIPMYPLIASPQLIPEDDVGGGTESIRPRSDEFSASDTDRIVQETLNLSWTLTWHPTATFSTSATADAEGGAAPTRPSAPSSSSSPVVVTAWLERGTLINGNTVMLEPTFMWRDAYQHPNTAARLDDKSRRRHRSSHPRRNNSASGSALPVLPTPHSLKLLNVARILPGVVVLDGSQRPLSAARNSCSLTIQTVGGESVVFEAASPAERNVLLKMWKVAVARFVTLAILEQFEVMADEFFTPRTAVPGC